MRLRYKIILFVVLLALPIVARLGWYYRGLYQAPDVPEVDTSLIEAEVPVYHRYQDEPSAGDGRVVVDVSHANRLELNDLDPLHDRLSARGVTVEVYDGEDGSLSALLKDASALIVIAPAEEYSDESEIQAIVDFVADGGRLLLAADPTRPAQESGVDYERLVIIPRISGVAAINSLANVFDISFFAEHVYNIHDNEGNFRNVKFSRFDESSPLTEGLEEVVLYAAHSMRSSGTPLIIGDENTLSPVRTGETDLAVAATSEDGRVLAIGDVNFMTVPYHTVADNDRFLSNVADWLAKNGRDRNELDDFPHMYSQPVDLVQASGNLLDPRLIAYGDELQALFQDADLPLELALLTSNPYNAAAQPPSPAGTDEADEATADEKPDVEFADLLAPGHDVLLVGAFDELDVTVQRYLSQTVGISITVVVTEGEQVAATEEEGQQPAEESTEEPAAEEAPVEEAPAEEETTERADGLAPTGDNLARGRDRLAAFQDEEPVPQGEIGLNESVDGELAEGEAHSWIFSSGPATIDIEVTTDEELDAVLMLLDPNDELVDFVDSGLSGEGEQMLDVEIPDDGDYTIIIADWLGSPGNYTLSVTESGAAEEVTAEEEPVAEEETGTETAQEPAATSQPIEGAPAGTIEIEHVGTFAIEGLTLFVIDHQSDRLVIMALAEDGDMALSALQRLVTGDFADCITSEQIIVCSTGVAPEAYGLDATLSAQESPSPPAEEVSTREE